MEEKIGKQARDIKCGKRRGAHLIRSARRFASTVTVARRNKPRARAADAIDASVTATRGAAVDGLRAESDGGSSGEFDMGVEVESGAAAPCE